jgi:hypothetical protein
MRRKNSVKTGSVLWYKLGASAASDRKFEMQLKMQTVEESLTALIVCCKTGNFVQIRTWASLIKGRSRQLVGFILFRTLESPINVKLR